MPIAIRYLKISNYRSIDELELHDIPAFAVFAGANGSGKSNFFNALDFVHLILHFNMKEALQRHGGWKNIRCISKLSSENTFLFETEINPSKNSEITKYGIKVNQLNTDSPELKEFIPIQPSHRLQFIDLLKELQDKYVVKYIRKKITFDEQQFKEQFLEETIKLARDFQSKQSEVWKSVLNFRLYRIEPRNVKEPNMSIHDDSELQRYGQNLAAVLRRLEKNDEMRETIIDWLQLIVPQLEIVQTETERLSGNAQLAFKETGTDKLFPAHLISDGTIYLLCLLVAMLDRPKIGITLIEEPERGLHPKAIMELVKGFREHATIESPIWLTTHSESVVRMLKDNELWLVDKKDGKTQINPVRNIKNLQLNLDEAWLSNALNGGLPW